MDYHFPRIPLFIAALLALAASVYILLTPSGTGVSVDSAGNTTVFQTSWLESQGGWGALILVVFTLLYAAPLGFYLSNKPGWALAACLPPLVLTLLAGFSIGLFYLPALFTVIVAAGALFIQSRRR
ncbi:MAG: hypothetical protein KIS85_00830 [Anaerolineales bacterium]|nr:hypothetical protein [Anaerolineales bacterium]